MAATAAETARVELPVVAAGHLTVRNPAPEVSISAVIAPATGMVPVALTADPAFQQTLVSAVVWMVPPEVLAKLEQHEEAALQTAAEVQIAN